METSKQTGSATSRATFDNVDLTSLRFDPTNPRFAGQAEGLTDAGIQEMLFNPPHAAALLVDSFLENGFIPYEPLVVRRQGNEHVVLEGNRRLAAVRHIVANSRNYPAAKVERLKRIPVLIFEEKADRTHQREVSTYLGVRHLVGYREWPAESKALFLDQNIRTKADLKRVMREFAIGKRDITRYLIPFRVKRAAKELLGGFEDRGDQEFWMLGEALSRSGIKEYIQLDVDPDSLRVRGFNRAKFGYLLEFLYGGGSEERQGSYRAAGTRRVTETRQLTRLGRVLASPKASRKLEDGSTLEDAELYAQSRDDAVQSLIQDLRIVLQKIIALQPTKSEADSITRQFEGFKSALRSLAKDA